MDGPTREECEHYLQIAVRGQQVLEYLIAPRIDHHDMSQTMLSYQVFELEKLLNPNHFAFDDSRRMDCGGDTDLTRGWIMIRTAANEIIKAMRLEEVCFGKRICWITGPATLSGDPDVIVVNHLPKLPETIPDRWKEWLDFGVQIIQRRVSQIQQAKIPETPRRNFSGELPYLNIELDHEYLIARRAGQECNLSAATIQWGILQLLVAKAGAYVRSIDFESAWPDEEAKAGRVATEISQLRKAIKPLGLKVQNKKRVGYQLTDAGEQPAAKKKSEKIFGA